MARRWAEINPLVTTADGRCARARCQGHHRRQRARPTPDLALLRGRIGREPAEVAARRANLTFIKLDGNVGCVVNGAGLAMATMDLVKYYGGDPANSSTSAAARTRTRWWPRSASSRRDPRVKAILFNIFGGITRTDDVANGIKTALEQFPVKVPIVVRLTGTNEADGGADPHGIGMKALNDMDEAVRQVVAAAKEAA
jgi:succinyl-CoA synthetase beta subunit